MVASFLTAGALFYVGLQNSKSLDGVINNTHYENSTTTYFVNKPGSGTIIINGKQVNNISKITLYKRNNSAITNADFLKPKKETSTNYQIQPLEYIPIKIRE